MHKKNSILSKLKRDRESKAKDETNNPSADRSKLLEKLNKLKPKIILDEATKAFLYPNKRFVPELRGNVFTKDADKKYIETGH